MKMIIEQVPIYIETEPPSTWMVCNITILNYESDNPEIYIGKIIKDNASLSMNTKLHTELYWKLCKKIKNVLGSLENGTI